MRAATLAALKALRRADVDPPVTLHGGRIVNTTGDGLLPELPVLSMPRGSSAIRWGTCLTNGGRRA